ncbi:hypothetical protein [Planctomicrobium sp. SH527]|uniref:hypothetical protein n=1 Tax=Planctomicrobium sp. SH527 TaxID=3448123 RepID=UPI003F5BDED7
MILETELHDAAYPGTSDQFNNLLIETLIDSFPGRNIDRLICVPKDAVGYAKVIQKTQGAQLIPEYVILKALMNIRRRKEFPKGLAPERRRLLQTRLNQLNCSISAEFFRELCSDCLADMYKQQTIDEVLCHPNEATALCDFVRRKGKCDYYTNELILSTLLNIRKAAGKI